MVLRFVIALCFMLPTQWALAAEFVEGDFAIASIDEIAPHIFKLTLKPEKSKKSSPLILESDYVHKRLKKGLVVKLTGKILRETPNAIELSQALFYIPTPTGVTPVWQLSRHSRGLDTSHVPLMEMHAPSTDYTIF